MSLTLRVKDSAGTYHELSSGIVTLKGAGDIGLVFDEDKYCVSIYRIANKADIDSQYAILTEIYPTAVISINGAGPLADGSMRILGSNCDNVDISAGTLTITDVCPSCKTCDAIAVVRQETEVMELYLNMIKDVQLYTAAVKDIRLGDANNGLYKDMKYLTAASIADMGCSAVISEQKPEAIKTGLALSVGSDLIRKYAALIHMWNFAVERVNSTTTITAVPNEPTGVCINTKYSLAQCDTNVTTQQYVYCAIRFEPESAAAVQDMLSIYIAPTLAAFDYTNLVEFPTAIAAETAIKEPSATTKEMIIEYPIKYAGTYKVQQALIPFIYVTASMKDSSGVEKEVDVRERLYSGTFAVAAGTVTTEGYTTTRVYTQMVFDPIQIAKNVTKDDINKQRLYPSASVYPFEGGTITTATNTWKIRVAWAISAKLSETEKTYEKVSSVSGATTESFLYTTPRAREPLNEFVTDSDL